MVEQREVVTKLVTILESDRRVRLALLFGSFASGRANASSDIDVAVAFSSPLTVDERVDLAQDLSKQLSREVDLVDLRTASGVLLQQILKDRKTVVRRDRVLLGDILTKRVIEECDFMPLLDRMLRARRERFARGTKSH